MAEKLDLEEWFERASKINGDLVERRKSGKQIIARQLFYDENNRISDPVRNFVIKSLDEAILFLKETKIANNDEDARKFLDYLDNKRSILYSDDKCSPPKHYSITINKVKTKDKIEYRFINTLILGYK